MKGRGEVVGRVSRWRGEEEESEEQERREGRGESQREIEKSYNLHGPLCCCSSSCSSAV